MVTRLLTVHRISLFGLWKICQRGFLLKSIFTELSEWFQLRVPLCMPTCVAWFMILRSYLLKFTSELSVRFKQFTLGYLCANTLFLLTSIFLFQFPVSSRVSSLSVCAILAWYQISDNVWKRYKIWLFWLVIHQTIYDPTGIRWQISSTMPAYQRRSLLTSPLTSWTALSSRIAAVPLFIPIFRFVRAKKSRQRAVACVSH